MAVDGRLNFDTKIDTKGFNQGTKSISNSLGRAGTSAKHLSKELGGVKSSTRQVSNGLVSLKSMFGKIAVAAAAAFSVKKLVDFGKQAVSVASDLQEVQNVVDTAFGSMADKMEDFADTSIKQFGISRLAAKQTGSTFMAMASGMGIAQSSASDMAIALTGLSADMASFYNVEQSVASTALKSVFTGETETLKQFGIVMTEANLEAFALSQGISKSVSDMSQAEKVQLRYNYVMSQTALAQGDFAKTQGSWANQTRILSEQWKEFSGTIGQALMGVLLPAVKVLNNAMSSLITYAQAAVKALADVFGIDISESAGSTGALVTDTTDIADSSADVADNYSDMADSAEKAAKANENQLAGFDKITKLSDSKSDKDNSGSSIGKIDMGLYGKQGTISTKVDIDTKGSEKRMNQFFKRIKKTLDKIKKIFGELLDPFKKAWSKKGEAVIKSIKKAFNGIKTLLSQIGNSFRTVWNNGTGQQTIENLLTLFSGINDLIGTIAERFASAWGDGTGTAIIQDLFNLFNTILGTINNIVDKTIEWAQEIDFSPFLESIDTLLQALQPFAETVGAGLEWFWNNVLLPLASFVIEDVIPSFLNLLSGAISALNAIIQGAQPMLTWLWDNVLQPFAAWTGGVIVDVIKKLTEKLKKFSDWAKDNQGAMDAITATILGFFAGIIFYHSAKKIVDVVGKIKKAIEKFGETGLTTSGKITALSIGIGLLFAGIISLAKNWDKLSSAERYITIFSSLATAAAAAAAAVAVFHTTWTVGIAAATIAAGLTTLGLSNYFGSGGSIGVSNDWGGHTNSGISMEEMQEQNQQKFDEELDKMTSSFMSSNNNKTDTKQNNVVGSDDYDFSEDEYLKKATDFYHSYDFDKNFDLPKFATGTVVPANYGEFLAILGDNKHETEVVSPLSTMKQAMKEAIAEMGGGFGGNGDVVLPINLNIDGRKVHKEIARINKQEIRKTGNNPLVPARI